MLLPAFVCLVLAAAGVGADGRHPVGEDVDDFLEAVNEGGQLYGIAYMAYPEPIALPDSEFSGLSLGELTSWERKGEAYTTGEDLQNFVVEATVGLRLFEIRVANFTSGSYTGQLSAVVLDNASSFRFSVKNRFQPECNVTVDSFAFTKFGNVRFYSGDDVTAGFPFEKSYIVESFRRNLLGEILESIMEVPFEEAMNAYICNGKTALMAKLKEIYSFMKEVNSEAMKNSS